MDRVAYLVVVLLSVSVNLVSAQGFIAFFTETTEPLDSICGGSGHPLADGCPVLIYWDSNSNGPDSTDPLASVCDFPQNCETGPIGAVNYNQFEINGDESGFGPGYFYPLTAFVSVGARPDPPRFYLRICLPGVRWESQVVTLLPGFSENEMTWTCTETECPGCLPPLNITEITATPGCMAIDLHWTYPHTPFRADSLFVLRSLGETPVRVATLTPAAQSLHDTITDPAGFHGEY
jgi:hypothetical protein